MNFNFAFSEEGEASRKGSSAAVRLALGETQIVAETKQFLEEQVIHLHLTVLSHIITPVLVLPNINHL